MFTIIDKNAQNVYNSKRKDGDYYESKKDNINA